MERVVIYTCIIGGYDELRQPLMPCPDVDYICFVGPGEKTSDRIGVWQIRELAVGDIPSGSGKGRKGLDAALLSRYPKMHPHVLLPEYDASLWIDGNIELRDRTVCKALSTKLTAGVKYSGVAHPTRSNVYEEAVMCRNMGYISWWKLARVLVFLATHGEKRSGGALMENNIIFRRHNDPDIVRLDELWWDKVMTLCRRDQLSFMWCLRKCGIPRDYLLPRGQNTRNHPGFRYLKHE